MTDEQVRKINGRAEMWVADPLPGGWVCAEADASKPDGVCGMPVESEPCDIHHPDQTDARDARIAGHLVALGVEPYMSGGRWRFELAEEQIVAFEDRVRAELADEADRRAKTHFVEGCDWYARDALLEFAEDIRAGRLAAGSSPDTTPEPQP